MSLRVMPSSNQPLEHEPVPAEQVVAGTPTTAVATLASVAGIEVGLWEHTAGTTRDVECDEVFVVVAGRATVAEDDGSTIEIGVGDVVVLEAGTHTTWTVHETLRKVWVTPPA